MKTLWYGGTIYTMIGEGDTTEAVLTEGDKIIQTGTYEQLAPLAEQQQFLNGAVMYPGFIDSHIHLIGYGELLLKRTVHHVTTAAQFLEEVRDEASKLDGTEWMYIDMWDENRMDRIPSIGELDALYSGPMLLRRVCRHVCLTNHAGLEKLQVTEQSEDPVGGAYGRDERGKLNGLLYENANDALLDLASANVPEEQLDEMIRLAIDDLVAHGITGVHSEDLGYFGHYTKSFGAYNRVIGKERYFRAHMLRNHRVFEEMIADGVTFDNPFLEPGAMKIFADGSFGGNTAYLNAPYEGTTTTGIQIHSDEEMASWVALARAHNTAVAVHAIGDGAIEQVITALEQVPAVEMRDRYIHGSLCTPAQIQRLATLNIIVDAQPLFLLSDMPWVAERLGEERSHYLYPWKDFLRAGIVLGAGTDAPIERISPFETIWAGVTRKKVGGEVYQPSQCLSRYEMLHMYTVGSAYTGNQETYRGHIAPNYDADFTILDRDLLDCTEEEILSTVVKKTVVAGQIVYEQKS